jgi:spore coat polysaccharide biosynthesis protein SpsF (cytidylyltransferase family)
MTEGVFIPIRLNSERLPQKSLKLINDQPLLYYMFNRILKSKSINSRKKIVVCTTQEIVDDSLEKIVTEYGANIFRGSKNDIIKRFYDANKIFNFKKVLLIDGDDPLIFPEHIDRVFDEHNKGEFDCIYTSNLPFGLNIKSVSSDALKEVCNNYLSKINDTGFGLYFTNTNIVNSRKINDFKFHKLLSIARLTLDYQEDFELIKNIIKDLYSDNNSDYSFKTFEKYIIKNPKMLDINLFRQNQNIQRSQLKVNLKYKNKDKVFKIIY